MVWDDNLNDEQIDAASFYGAHCCLLAGPGTGKTMSLTRRVIYLIEELGCEPSNITALTFTRAAAAELSQRIKEELGDIDSFPNISTLHSFALRLVLANPSKTRLPQPVRIADDYEEEIIIDELKDILNLTKTEVRRCFNKLSADWDVLKADEEGWKENFPNPRFLGGWEQHREIYGYTLRSELVYQLKGALNEEDVDFIPPITYLLVDEYQDLNPCDLAVIQLLTEHGAELFSAGDDDQSIYGFRFANPEGIRQFLNAYDPSERLELKECMRCDKNILDLSLFVAHQDPNHIAKGLRCRDGADDGEVKILRFNGQRNEADGIADICQHLINNEEIEPSKVLILLRSDRNRVFSNVLRDSLEDRGISVNIASNPLAPLETDEGRQFICFLQLLINPKDNLAWRVLLKIRKNNIGPKSFKELYNVALQQGLDFYGAIEFVLANPDSLTAINSLQNEFETILEYIDNIEVGSDLACFVKLFSEEIINDEETRNDVLSIFEKVIESYDKIDLEKLLKAINLSLSNEEQDSDNNFVSIMTMHQAKGLTADVVFIVAAEDEYIPGRAAGESELGDSRRLLYVSLTRAKHYLYITHCKRRTGAQSHTGSNPRTSRRRLSRFLRQNVFPSQRGDDYITDFVL